LLSPRLLFFGASTRGRRAARLRRWFVRAFVFLCALCAPAREDAPLASKVQIMMVPNDGKFFFANDVLHGALPAPSGAPAPQDKQ
jgi:hypothetical protein